MTLTEEQIAEMRARHLKANDAALALQPIDDRALDIIASIDDIPALLSHVAEQASALEAQLTALRARVAELEKTAGDFVEIIRKRHYGRMPDEVQSSFDALDAALHEQGVEP